MGNWGAGTGAAQPAGLVGEREGPAGTGDGGGVGGPEPWGMRPPGTGGHGHSLRTWGAMG